MTPKQFITTNYPEATAERHKKNNGDVYWIIRLSSKDVATGKTQKEAWQNAANILDAPVLTKSLSDSLKRGVKKLVRVGKPRSV